MDALPKIPGEFKEDAWTQAVIRKGFVRRGYIEQRVGLYPAVRFVFTPMLPEHVDEMEYAIGNLKNPVQATGVVATHLTRRLKAWSLDEPINEINIRSLGNALLDRIRLIVSMKLPTDIDPQWEDETSEFKGIDELLGESLESSVSD